MESWSVEDDSFSFLRSAPLRFSLHNREGPNRVEIFDITSISSHRSAISETTCLCDIFGDDCESPALSSSPPSGSDAKREDDVFTLADDTLNDSPGSYHTAPCSEQLSDSSEMYEDSKEALNPVLPLTAPLPENTGTLPLSKSKGTDLSLNHTSTSLLLESKATLPLLKSAATPSEPSDIDCTSKPRDTSPSSDPKGISITFEPGTTAISHKHRCTAPSPELKGTDLLTETTAPALAPLEDREILHSPEPRGTEPRTIAIPHEPRATSLEPEPRTTSPETESSATALEPELRYKSLDTEPRATSTDPEHTAISPETEPSAKSLEPEPRYTFPGPEPRATSSDPEPTAISPETESSAKSLEPEPRYTSPGPEPRATSSDPEPTAISPETESSAKSLEPEPKYTSPDPEPRATSPHPEPTAIFPVTEPSAKSLEPEPRYTSPDPEPRPTSPESEPRNISPETEASTTSLEPESRYTTPDPEPRAISPEPELRAMSPQAEPSATSLEPEPRYKSPDLEPRATSPEPELRHISPETEPSTTSLEPESRYTTPDPEFRAISPEPELRAITSETEPCATSLEPEPRYKTPDLEPRATSPEPEPRPISTGTESSATSLEPEPSYTSPDPEPRATASEPELRAISPEIECDATISEQELRAMSLETELSATYPKPEPSVTSLQPELSTVHPSPEPRSPDSSPKPRGSQLSIEPKANFPSAESRRIVLFPETTVTNHSSEPRASDLTQECRITDPSLKSREINFSLESRATIRLLETRGSTPPSEPQSIVPSHETQKSELLSKSRCPTSTALANSDANEGLGFPHLWFTSETVLIRPSRNQKREVGPSKNDAPQSTEPVKAPQKPEVSATSGESPTECLREGDSWPFRDRKERGGKEEEEHKEEKQGGAEGEENQGKASYREQQVELSFNARNRKVPASPSSAHTYREPQPGMPAGCYSDCLLVTEQQQQNLLRAHSSQKENQARARKPRLVPLPNRRSTSHSAPDYSSETSSMGSELDEADNEVKWFTDLAFRSLSSPQVDYLDVFNSSHRSSTNISQPSIEDSPGANAWSAYADLRGSVRQESDDLPHQPSAALAPDRLDTTRHFEIGSFECVDVVLESREEVQRGKRTVPKRQIQLKRRDTGELRASETSEAAAEAAPTQRRSRDILLRQHSTPATIQEELYRYQADTKIGDRKQKIQKSLSLDETSSKTKIASCLIKSVLSKKMHNEHKLTNSQVPLQNGDSSSTVVKDLPSDSSHFVRETPKTEMSNQSSGLPSDCSLSSEDLPHQVKPAPHGESIKHGSYDPKPQPKPLCRRDCSPLQSGTGSLESQKNNAGKLDMRSELVIPFERKKTEKQSDRKTWKQSSKETDEQRSKETEKHRDKEAEKQSDREKEKEKDSERWKQSGRETLNQSGRETEEQSSKETWNQSSRETEKQSYKEPGKQFCKATEKKSSRETEKQSDRDWVQRQANGNLSEKHFSDSANASSRNIGTAATRAPGALSGMTNRDEECYARPENYKQQSARTFFMSKTPEITLKPCTNRDNKKSSLKVGCCPGNSEPKPEESCEAPSPKGVAEKEKQDDKMQVEQTGNGEAFEKSKFKAPMHKVRDVRKMVKNTYNLSFKATSVLAQECVSRGEVEKLPLSPTPMQIECKAISRKGEGAAASGPGERQEGWEKAQISPQVASQVPPQKIRETALLHITPRSCLTEGVAMPGSHDTVATVANSLGMSESGDLVERVTGGGAQPPKLGSIPKLPSKDREVSTLLFLQNGLMEDRLEPGAPPPLSLTTSSCSRSVSMLLKEKGFQADIGVCDAPVDGYKAAQKHVNRLEVPLQICSTEEAPAEPRREDPSELVQPLARTSPSAPVPLTNTRKEPYRSAPPEATEPELERTNPKPQNNDTNAQDTTSFLLKKPAVQATSCYRPQLTEVEAVSTCIKKTAASAASTSSCKQQQTVSAAAQVLNYTQKSIMPARSSNIGQPAVSTMSCYKQKPDSFSNPQQSNLTCRDSQEQVTSVSSCSSEQSAVLTTVQAPSYSQQPAIRTKSSKQTLGENLRFYASDDPPSYDERESFSPLLLRDLPPRKLDRYHPATRAPACSCTVDGDPSPSPRPSELGLPTSAPTSAQGLPSQTQAPPSFAAPPLAHLHQQRSDACSLTYKTGSPQATKLTPAQGPLLFQPLHQPPGLPACPALLQQPRPEDSRQTLPGQQMDRQAPHQRSPQQPAPMSGGGPYSGHPAHSPGVPSLEVRPQYLCSPQGFVPSFSSEFGGEGGGGSGVMYPEGGNSLAYGQSPRRVLLDPETGKYFYIEVPVQPLRKMLFDPEMGQYVEVLIPQQALSHSGLYPPIAAPYPSLHNSSMYAPQYLPYSVPPHSQAPSPRHPEAPPLQGLHQNSVRFGSPGSQGTKPDLQNHPSLDQSYLESMYYIPTGMTASPKPTPPDFYHKLPSILPNSGGKRS